MPLYFSRQYYELDPTLAFVLMPFDARYRHVYDEAILPAVTAHDLQCKRADEVDSIRGIMEDVWERVTRARFLIADLSGQNPNVFYEVGLAHAIGKSVILLSQEPGHNPFDIGHVRTLGYTDDPPGLTSLRSALSNRIRQVLLDDPGVATPEFVEAQGTLGESFRRWERFTDVLPSAESFQLINRYADLLLPTSSAALRAFFLHCAIKHGIDMIYWAQVNEDNELVTPVLAEVLKKGERRPTYRVGLVLEYLSPKLKDEFRRTMTLLPDEAVVASEILGHAMNRGTLTFWREVLPARIGERYAKELLYQAHTSRRRGNSPAGHTS